MNTILTFVGGGERDRVILKTALAAAIPFSAHLDFLHAHVPSTQALRHAHLDYAMGDGLRKAIVQLGVNSETFARLAAENVRAFCAATAIEMRDEPAEASVSATSKNAPSAEDATDLTNKSATGRFFEETS